MIRYSAAVVTVDSTANGVWVPQRISEKVFWDIKQLGYGVPSSGEVTAHTHAESATCMTNVSNMMTGPPVLTVSQLTQSQTSHC
jgi:hypothetical protein